MSKRPSRPGKNNEKTAKQPEDRNPENNKAGNDPLAIAKVKPALFETEESNHERSDTAGSTMIERIRNVFKWIKWWRTFEAVGILAGITYAAITYLQWRDLRHNFEVDERAWLKFKYAILPDKISDTDVMNAWLLTVENVGKSPANHAFVNAHFEIVPKTAPPSLAFNRPHTQVQVSLLFPTDYDSFPVALQSSSNAVHSLSKDEIRDLISGSSYLAVFAQATYEDQFGEHWTKFCNWKAFNQNPDTFSARDCVAWNEAGDGKPPQ